MRADLAGRAEDPLYPGGSELSGGLPYDRYILDRRLRYVGDPVAIVAAETEEAADKALKLIKVKYEVLEPVLDFRASLDNPVLIHPEDDWKELYEQGADVKRNLLCHEDSADGDCEAVLADCDVVVDETYHTVADNQAMMETFRAYSYLDAFGRLNIVPSTQIAFHVRRIIATALGIPKSKVRVVKPPHRRRLRRQADGGGGALSRHCDMADRQARHDRLHPGGDHHLRLSAA